LHHLPTSCFSALLLTALRGTRAGGRRALLYTTTGRGTWKVYGQGRRPPQRRSRDLSRRAWRHAPRGACGTHRRRQEEGRRRREAAYCAAGCFLDTVRRAATLSFSVPLPALSSVILYDVVCLLSIGCHFRRYKLRLLHNAVFNIILATSSRQRHAVVRRNTAASASRHEQRQTRQVDLFCVNRAPSGAL